MNNIHFGCSHKRVYIRRVIECPNCKLTDHSDTLPRDYHTHMCNNCLVHFTPTRKYEATNKSPEVDNLLESITGRHRLQMIQSSKCATCDAPNLNFRDNISIKEYRISAMCQDCQDRAFTDPGTE